MTQISPNTKPMRTVDFMGALGVNTHENYYNTAYANEAQGVADLKYLGITHVRDALPDLTNQDYWKSYEQAMAAGIIFDFIIPNTEQNISGILTVLNSLEGMNPNHINAVEGLNEVIPENIPSANIFQAALYSSIHSDIRLSNVKVYDYTILSTDKASFAAEGNQSNVADYGNEHAYSPFPPNYIDSWFGEIALQSTPNSPFVITETGYSTGLHGNSVPDDVAAKYLLDDIFDLIKGGASLVYVYELLDEMYDPYYASSEQHFGLFNFDGTPKKSAIALHALTKILDDPGATASTFTPNTLSYTVSGLNSSSNATELEEAYYHGILEFTGDHLPVYGNSVLMAKSDGSFDLALWREPSLWNAAASKAIVSPAVSVTVTFGQSVAAIKVFDPMSGTTPIVSSGGAGSITLSVTDHPLIVEVTPSSSKIWVASDVLHVIVSEDSWEGNAQYTISLDGSVIGGVRVATASHATGASQDVSLTGNWGSSLHTIGVSFINDAYGGTAATDRNLFVDGISYDGQAATSKTASLWSNGTSNFTTGAAGTVTLLLAEDAYQGDAQYSVAIDGMQVGSVGTVVTSNANGEEAVNVLGTLTAGRHDVAVSFLNDLYAGSSATDRNLYVKGLEVNGAGVRGASATLFSNETDHFSIIVL